MLYSAAQTQLVSHIYAFYFSILGKAEQKVFAVG